ncbi:MAG: TolC family protein [Burkholderiaceae bacterium]|nr:TolC family protein [Burkholderiaceae bacterium]
MRKPSPSWRQAAWRPTLLGVAGLGSVALALAQTGTEPPATEPPAGLRLQSTLLLAKVPAVAPSPTTAARLAPAPARAATSAAPPGKDTGALRCWDTRLPQGTLDLLTAVQLALCHSPRTREALAQVGVQQADIGVARSAYWPQVNATLGAGKVRQSTRVNDPMLAPLINLDSSPRQRSASLKASLTLLDFGVRSALLDQATALLESSQAGYDGTWQSVLFTTSEAYYSARMAEASRLSKIEIETLAGQSAATAQAKYQAGIVALSDQLQAELAHRQAHLERMQADLDTQLAQAALARLIGAQPGAPLQLPVAGDELPNRQQWKTVAELVQDATRDHPDVRAARAAVQAADARLRATRAEGLPKLLLGAEAVRTDQLGQPPSLGLNSTDTFQRSQQINLQLSIPLFEGFGREARVQAASQLKTAKEASLDAAELQVQLDVWRSYQTLTASLDLVATASDLRQSARKAFDIASGRYRDGVGNILELLTAQNTLARAGQQRLEAATQYQIARLKLAAGVGQLSLADYAR